MKEAVVGTNLPCRNTNAELFAGPTDRFPGRTRTLMEEVFRHLAGKELHE